MDCLCGNVVVSLFALLECPAVFRIMVSSCVTCVVCMLGAMQVPEGGVEGLLLDTITIDF